MLPVHSGWLRAAAGLPHRPLVRPGAAGHYFASRHCRARQPFYCPGRAGSSHLLHHYSFHLPPGFRFHFAAARAFRFIPIARGVSASFLFPDWAPGTTSPAWGGPFRASFGLSSSRTAVQLPTHRNRTPVCAWPGLPGPSCQPIFPQFIGFHLYISLPILPLHLSIFIILLPANLF